jgi:Zn-dependent protease with chaperone function
MHKRNLLILSVFVVTIQANLQAFAAPKIIDRYAEAKKEIPEDVYPVYRALERLIQTNKVDSPVAITVRSTTPEQCEAMTGNKGMCAILGDLPDDKAKDSMIAWAIQVVSSTNFLPNASADGGNLIRMGKSLMNGLIDKPAAMTCVVAHELAHITEGHIKKIQTRNSELDLKTSDKVASAIKNAHNAQKS